MFTKDGILAFHRWTHECLDLVYRHAEGLSPEQFTAEIPGFGKASVRDQLVHILSCERGWVRALEKLPWERMPTTDFRDASSLGEPRRQIRAETVAYLQGLSEEALNRDLSPPPERWIGPARSPAFVLHHILTHAFHHKGQVVAIFRLLGCPAPETDLQRE